MSIEFSQRKLSPALKELWLCRAIMQKDADPTNDIFTNY